MARRPRWSNPGRGRADADRRQPPGHARAYIVYREQHATLRADGRRWWMWKAPSTNTSRADWRVNANANQGYSLGGLILNVAGKVTANYIVARLHA